MSGSQRVICCEETLIRDATASLFHNPCTPSSSLISSHIFTDISSSLPPDFMLTAWVQNCFFSFLPSTPLYQGCLVRITISQCLSCNGELYSLCSHYHWHPWNICYIPTSTSRDNAEVRRLLTVQHHDKQWRGCCGEKWTLTPFFQVSFAFVIPQLLLRCFSLSLLLTVIKVCEDRGLWWMLDSGQTVLSIVWILAIFKLIYIGGIYVLQAWHFNHTAVTAPVRSC